MIGRFVRSPVGVCLALALLLHLRQVSFLAEPHNRYMLHWRQIDAFALLSTLVITAVVICLIHALLGGVAGGRLARLRSPFLMLIGVSAAVSFASRFDFLTHTGLSIAWWFGLVLVVVPSAVFAERMHPILLRVGAAFSLVAFATFVQILVWRPWSGPRDSLSVSSLVESPGTPVYLFLFDEWSFERSFHGVRFREELPNLRGLQAESLTFLQAFAPAPDTEVSLPRLLFSRDENWTLEKERGVAYWVQGDDRVPTAGSRQLFGPFERAGYRTAMVGYYLPYRRLLGDGVDVARSVPHVPWGEDFWESLWLRSLESFRHLVGPEGIPDFISSKKVAYSEHWRDINREIYGDVMQILNEWPENTFLFSHWPVPHAPFVFEADGSYRGAFQADRVFGTEADYLRSLRNLDRIVGDLLGNLEASGRLERSLLILTSDHGWKKRDEVPIRVPLVIKWPHQREGVLVEGAFPTLALPGLLESFAAGRRDIQDGLEYIAVHRIAMPEP